MSDAAKLPVSVLLLARDETHDLEELLPTLAFAAEVVVVWDPRGDAATRAAAQRLGARVFARGFDGFGPQRRHALAQCEQPWVLWIDADERCRGDAAAALAFLADLPAEGGATAWKVWRETRFLGREIRHCGWERERVLRVFRRDAWDFDDAPVHEQLVPLGARAGEPATLPLVLDHASYRTWDDCVTKLVRYGAAGAEKSWRAGRRAGVLDVALRPPLRFLRQYVLQLGFLDGAHGFALCALAAAQVFLKYGQLWARSRRGVA